MHDRIDKLAFAGYDYATSNGINNKSSLIKSDLDLMAFNAGISNANVKHQLNVPPLLCSPTVKRHDNYKGASHKQLQVTGV